MSSRYSISFGMIAHCIKNDRNRIWIYVLVFTLWTPFIGSAIYACVEVLPDLLRTRTSRRAMRGIRQTLDPEGDLRRAENEMMVSGNVAARQQYANELVRLGRTAEALTIYQNCLTGVFADDPKLLLGYAHAQFAANDPAGTRKTLDHLIAKNPGIQVTGWPPAVRAGARGRRKQREGARRIRNGGGVLRRRRSLRALCESVEALGPAGAGPGDAAGAPGSGQVRSGTLSKGSAGVARRGAEGAAELGKRPSGAGYFLRLMERNETPSIMAL
jgi:hypothetical protein